MIHSETLATHLGATYADKCNYWIDNNFSKRNVKTAYQKFFNVEDEVQFCCNHYVTGLAKKKEPTEPDFFNICKKETERFMKPARDAGVKAAKNCSEEIQHISSGAETACEDTLTRFCCVEQCQRTIKENVYGAKMCPFQCQHIIEDNILSKE